MLTSILFATLLIQTPPKVDPHQAELDADIALGKKYAAETEKQLKLSTDKAAIERVQRVGAVVAAIAQKQQVKVLWGDPRLNVFKYQFKVVKGSDVNAFSLPGGFIYVYEGLVKYVETDDELAGVLAHEVAHAAFRHIHQLQKEQSKVDTLTIPLILISILAGGQNAGAGALMGELLNTAVGNGWSLKAEQSADFGGYQYLKFSPYNQTAMLTVMERLARDERNSPKLALGIFRTHPPSRERANAIVEAMNRDHVAVRRSAVTTSFRVTQKGGTLLFGGVSMFELGGPDAEKRATGYVTKLNDMFDATPELVELRADGSQIYYGTRPIVDLVPDDAAQAKLSMDGYVKKALRSLRAALFSLNFNVWDETG